ncbi:hypothetical protein MHEI_28620 [Mycobacterium heidelbergense]|nr:hypothetical protein MHEI_28620 [Mycobacterium heidelbergense]
MRTLVQLTPITRSDTLAACGLMTVPPAWPRAPPRRAIAARTAAALEPLDHPVDALGEGADVIGIDGGEHRDP